MNNKSEPQEVVELLAVAGTAAATAGVTLTALPAAGVAVLPAIVGGLTGLALKAFHARLERKAAQWFQLVADLMEMGSPEEAARVIQEQIEEPWAHKSVVEGVRAVVNDIDDVALPALAKIVARRLKSKSPPDRRDKRTIQMLCELDGGTYEALRQIVGMCLRDGFNSRVQVKVQRPKGEEEHLLLVRRSGPTLPEEVVVDQVQPPPVGSTRVFFLLKKHDLGSEGKSGVFGAEGGPHLVYLEADSVRFLNEILS